MIWKHFEAEIHSRLHGAFNCQLQLEQTQDDQYIKDMLQHLEKNSDDKFEILTEEFKK
jgi:spore coat protein CotH